MDSLESLETPALLLDAGKLERNVARMRARLDARGVTLRQHVKTAKSIDVARLGMPTARGPVTVSTLKEAEYFLAHGVTDILYAVGIVPSKLDHVADLRKRGADLAVIVDNVAAARAVAAKGSALGVRFPVLIEIDCDGHRSGVKPGDPLLLAIADALRGTGAEERGSGAEERSSGAELRGVMTHAGSSYDCTSVDAIRAMAEQERRAVVDCAEALRGAGHPVPVVSVGSTPTATYAERLDGVTECRAGVFVFFDLVMAGIDVCALDDIAVSVLGTVIGHQPEKGWVIIDAGWMALSRDRGTAKQRVDQGYGVVCDVDGRPIDDLIVAAANQEHGIVARRDGGPLDPARLPLGTLLRVLPNHVCATAAQHDAYRVVRGSRAIEATWPRFHGW